MAAPLNTRAHWIYPVAGLLLFAGALLALWQAVPVSPLLMPSADAVAAKLQESALWLEVFRFLTALIPAFLKATLYGVSLGVALGYFPILAAIVYPVLRVLRELPFIALIPLFVLWFGLSASQSSLLPTLSMSIVILVRTFEVFSRAGGKRGEAKQGAGIGEVLRQAPEELFPSLREAFRLGVFLIIAGEFMASTSGIGFLLINSMQVFETARVVAIVLVLWAVMVLADVVFTVVKWVFVRMQAPGSTQVAGAELPTGRTSRQGVDRSGDCTM